MHKLSIPHPTLTITAQRCSVADLPPLKDWLDVYLSGNYFFREGHLRNVLADAKIATFAILVDATMAGVCILYRHTTLHNLYLAPEFRRQGVGRAIIEFFAPTIIRSKSDQQEGDPTPAYERAGYHVTGYDPKRPHIRTMQPAPQTPAVAEHPAIRSPGQPGPQLSTNPFSFTKDPTTPGSAASTPPVNSSPGGPPPLSAAPSAALIPNHVPGTASQADQARAAKLAEREAKKKQRLADLKEAQKLARQIIANARKTGQPPPQPQPQQAPNATSAPVTASAVPQVEASNPAAAAFDLDIWNGAD